MKRWLSMLLAVLLLCPCSAWARDGLPERYEAAAALMVAGDYAGAAEAFGVLTGYADAPQMTIYCRGLALMAEGDYARAAKAFAHLGTFKDAPVMMIACQGAQKRAEGVALMGNGTFREMLAAEPVLMEAAAYFDQIDYLPKMAAQAAECRALLDPLNARRFDRVVKAEDGRCIVVKNDLYGVVDRQGQLLIPCEWDSIVMFPGVLVVERDEKLGLLNWSGEMLWPCTAEQYSDSYVNDTVTLYWHETVNGETVERFREFLPDGTPLPADVQLAGDYAGDMVVIYDQSGYGLYHIPSETIVLPCTQQEWMIYGEGYIIARDDYSSLVYCRLDGTEYPVPDYAWPITGAGLWRIEDETGYRLVDETGTVLLESESFIQSRNINSLPDDWIIFRCYVDGVQQDYLMDVQGRMLLQADSIDQVSFERYVFCTRNGLMYLIDMQNPAEPLVCAEKISMLIGERYVTLTEDGVQYTLDLQSGARFEMPYKAIYSAGEGFFKAKTEGGKYVLLRSDGQRLNAEEYDSVYSFRDGYVQVKQGDLYSLLDTQGNVALSGCKYIFYEEGGFYKVTQDNKTTLLNTRLEPLTPNTGRYTYYSFYAGLCYFSDEKTLINSDGVTVLDTSVFDSYTADDARIYTIENSFLNIYDGTGCRVYGEELD